MDIIVTDIATLHNNGEKRRQKPRPARSGNLKDRRKAKKDRRKSVRDGVYVSLSFKKDRRSGTDRRGDANHSRRDTVTISSTAGHHIALER
jgi:hypothetical protein